MTIADIIRIKGDQVITVRPRESLLESIQTLANHGIGALVVEDEGRVLGILTERDALREIARHPKQLNHIRVADIMNQDVIIGLMEDSLDYVMELMTQKGIRHLPVMKHGELAGIISIGDVIKARSHMADIEVRHLADYYQHSIVG